MELGLYTARLAHVPGAAQKRLMRLRDQRFDAGLARHLKGSDALLLASYGAAKQALERAQELSVPSILNYPIAHHGFARALLEEEGRLVPEYAATLQFPSDSARMDRDLERELDAADAILGLSEFHIQTFIERGISPAKMLKVPLGVDLDLFQPGNRNSNDGIFRVLFVGQITQRKGLSYLIDGFRRAAIPNSELTLVGNIVGTSAPWEHEPGVRHVPSVRRTALPALYHRANVFVLPSLIEGFCLTAMEALACGLPGIVTPHTFGDDVIRDGVEGFNVPIRDADAIADRLRHIHAHPEVATPMSVAARKRAESYSWGAFGEGIVQQTRRLAARAA